MKNKVRNLIFVIIVFNHSIFLPFSGEVITVLTRTDTQADWWEGKLHGRVGIFPANYVKMNS